MARGSLLKTVDTDFSAVTWGNGQQVSSRAEPCSAAQLQVCCPGSPCLQHSDPHQIFTGRYPCHSVFNCPLIREALPDQTT